ncbi:proteasome subunit alpha type-7-1 [Drosophila ficusphila]|uniref:proteasome subunit alpha type-7-1 n=1 Tax=Drosophila ficusphila TaxID=30025 RepID=UPI0007E7E4AE|nr:proteasome subunit alpha type-7-1 [Drosophila ficusphila]
MIVQFSVLTIYFVFGFVCSKYIPAIPLPLFWGRVGKRFYNHLLFIKYSAIYPTSKMSSSYDRAVTIFSPDGHLLQVEYAQEAVRKGATAVGVRGANVVVLAVEKNSVAKLQEDRTVRKISMLDHHAVLAFAGLTADARILINRAQVECQSHRLNFENPVTLEYISKYIAQLKQKYTQSNGRRPFGLSCLIGGFDANGSAHLFQTEPSGILYEYVASATGRSSNTVREFLEKTFCQEKVSSECGAVKLAIRALLEAQSGQNKLEVAIMEHGKPMKMLDSRAIATYVRIIEGEKEQELAFRKYRALDDL